MEEGNMKSCWLAVGIVSGILLCLLTVASVPVLHKSTIHSISNQFKEDSSKSGLSSDHLIRIRRDTYSVDNELNDEEVKVINKRDIKTISVDSHEETIDEDNDLKTQIHSHSSHQPNQFQTQDIQIVDRKSGSQNPSSLSLSMELASHHGEQEIKDDKGWIHVNVLGSDKQRSKAMIQMTWGASVEHHISFKDNDLSSSYHHAVASIHSLCSQSFTHKWYLLIKDRVYINLERLEEILVRLSHEDNIILGVPTPEHSHYCSLDAAILMSRTAQQRMCSVLDYCSGYQQEDMEDSHALGHCLEKGTGVQCTDVLKLSNSLYLPGNDVSAVQPHIDLLSKTLYIGPVNSIDDMYKLHLVYTERRIALTQKYMFHLADQLTPNANQKQRPKRNSPQTNFEQTVLQSHGALLNNSNEPYFEFFDRKKYIYSDACAVSKSNITTSKGFITSEAKAFHVLKSQIGGNEAEDVDYFGYKITRPNSGLEYQFYFIHEDQVDRRGYYYDKLYQIIVEQPYKTLEISNKRTHSTEDITIVTIADDLAVLESLLQSLIDTCRSVMKSNTQCSILILYDTMLFTKDTDLSTFDSILDTIDRKQVLIQTLNIGSSSSIMNNFQRAVVSVHETLLTDSLIIFMHPKSHITSQFLYRCQANAGAGSSAYFPIPFQLKKDPDLSQNLDPDSGFWKNTDFDTFCVHTKDLQKLVIVPKSPQMLYQFLASMGQLKVIRLPDSGVWRLWDDVICAQYEDSSNSNNNIQQLSKCKQDFIYRNL